MSAISSIRNYKDYLQYIRNWDACSSQEQDQLRKWYREYYSHNKEAERKRYRDYYASNAEAERERLKRYRKSHKKKWVFHLFQMFRWLVEITTSVNMRVQFGTTCATDCISESIEWILVDSSELFLQLCIIQSSNSSNPGCNQFRHL